MDKTLEKITQHDCLCCKYKIEDFEKDVLALSIEDGIEAYQHFDKYKDRTFDWKLRERYDESKTSFIESKLSSEDDLIETYDVLSKHFGDKILGAIAKDKHCIEALVSAELPIESVTGEELYQKLVKHSKRDLDFDEGKYHLILVGTKLGYVDHIEALDEEFFRYIKSCAGSPASCGIGVYRTALQLKDALEKIEQELGLGPADRPADVSFLKEVEDHKGYYDWYHKKFTWFGIDMDGDY